LVAEFINENALLKLSVENAQHYHRIIRESLFDINCRIVCYTLNVLCKTKVTKIGRCFCPFAVFLLQLSDNFVEDMAKGATMREGG